MVQDGGEQGEDQSEAQQVQQQSEEHDLDDPGGEDLLLLRDGLTGSTHPSRSAQSKQTT